MITQSHVQSSTALLCLVIPLCQNVPTDLQHTQFGSVTEEQPRYQTLVFTLLRGSIRQTTKRLWGLKLR